MRFAVRAKTVPKNIGDIRMWKIHGAGIAAGICAMSLGVASGSACAQSAGSFSVSTGWTHAVINGSADPLTLVSVGGKTVNQTETGTGGHANDANTLGVMLEYYVTDHIGVALQGGYPIYLDFEGSGAFAKYGVIAHAKPGVPQLNVRYHFFEAQSKFRPFVGIGVNYTWIYNGAITNSAFLHDSVGPGGSATVSGSSSWNPVFEIGGNYKLSKHWSITGSLAYMPLKTTLTLTGTTAAGVTLVSKAKVGLNPLISFVGVTYTF
ncbi:OmpW/AlkL family protein [Burkholderia lata]|nr:OmpW family outer membrane protein [Burkholderia lata]